ncbi:PREDICTED: uncharacterized protein C6orf141 homolog [Condylura cristata]|uniref:uncharacterized protein C6orf141 homolog n=1 Tax=Condylura cristata TaxID=143302 RepID=UPI000642B50C|nr:PREDICTED: uncharacterized protein C6orf141 homolog [Condylura cristata]
MNDPPTRMGALGAHRAANFTDHPYSLGRSLGLSRSFEGEVGRSAPLAAGTPNSTAAEASESWSDALEDCGSRKNPSRESWVRDKVLFLLHPERCLGTEKGPTGEEMAGGEHVSQMEGDDWESECGSPLCPRRRRNSGTRAEAAAGAPPRDPAAPPKSVLVRVVDYQVTQEVLQTAWTNSQMTTRTEERSMTAITFRTNRE